LVAHEKGILVAHAQALESGRDPDILLSTRVIVGEHEVE
jgi:hypothetical protein